MTIRARLTSSLCIGLLLFAACGSKPTLISKTAAVPTGVNLSGDWRIRDDPGVMRKPETSDTQDPIIFRKRDGDKPRRRKQGVSAQVFLEFGEDVKISQTEHGLFISYDRSVVEEYTFGENRLIEIGPIEALRVSGWDETSFVVETLDREGSTLFESWQLDSSKAVLERNIRISRGDKDIYSVRQVFDRK